MMSHKPPHPSAYFLGALAAMLALHLYWPVWQVSGAWIGYAGLVLVGLGLGMNIWAASAFQQAGTPVKPFTPCKALVTQGVYRYSRNPMYLGMLLILAGLWASLGSLSPGLVFPPLVWVLQTRFIGVEERQLEDSLGEAFRAYRSKVRRWF